MTLAGDEEPPVEEDTASGANRALARHAGNLTQHRQTLAKLRLHFQKVSRQLCASYLVYSIRKQPYGSQFTTHALHVLDDIKHGQIVGSSSCLKQFVVVFT